MITSAAQGEISPSSRSCHLFDLFEPWEEELMRNSKVLLRALFVGLATLLSEANVAAQEANCSGVLFDEKAVVRGVRQSRPYGNTYYASFRGEARTENTVFEMRYEGIATDAFPGLLRNNRATIRIKVLDMTGGRGNRMVIYGAGSVCKLRNNTESLFVGGPRDRDFMGSPCPNGQALTNPDVPLKSSYPGTDAGQA